MKKDKIIKGRTISRRELSKIRGGGGPPSPPDTPSGGLPCALRKCCLNAHPEICSSCISVTSAATCNGGSSLVNC